MDRGVIVSSKVAFGLLSRAARAMLPGRNVHDAQRAA
jgi:hypothetical protein